MKRILGLAILAGLASGCASIPSKSPFLSGQWGGDHAVLVLEGGLGRIEYDCASGTIDEAVAAGPDGSFTAAGTHRTGQGGPVRVGQIFRSSRATYSGRVTDDIMILSARLEDGTVIGPFTLTRGAEGQLTRCL